MSNRYRTPSPAGGPHLDCANGGFAGQRGDTAQMKVGIEAACRIEWMDHRTKAEPRRNHAFFTPGADDVRCSGYWRRGGDCRPTFSRLLSDQVSGLPGNRIFVYGLGKYFFSEAQYDLFPFGYVDAGCFQNRLLTCNPDVCLTLGLHKPFLMNMRQG